jgi:uncharacterized protein
MMIALGQWSVNAFVIDTGDSVGTLLLLGDGLTLGRRCAMGEARDDSTIRDILEKSRVIAVVGISPKEDRPSHRVALYLKGQGYRIIPVNPAASTILGEKAYGSLDEIPPDTQVDVVDVFRRSEDTPAIAEQAVAKGARVLWLQEGIVNEEAANKARDAGLMVVMDRCMLKEHRLFVGRK